MELTHYFRFLRRHLGLLIGAAVVVGAVAAAVAAERPVVHQANGSILLTLRDTRPLANAYDFDQFYALQAADIYATNIATWLNSDLVNRSIRETARAPEGRVRARKSGGTIEISATAPQPQQATALVNATNQLVADRTKTQAQNANRASFDTSVSSLGSKEVVVNPARYGAAGAATGLLLGLILALIREAGRRSVHDPQALRHAFRSVIAASGRRRPNPDEPADEAYQVLREELDLTKAVLVMATLTRRPGQAALGLGIALARAGRSVLILDAHFRDQPVADLVGVPNDKGLSDVLQGTALATVIRKTVLPGLSVVTAGTATDGVDDRLTSDRARKVVAAAQKAADVVIISTGRNRARLLVWRRVATHGVFAVQRDDTRLDEISFVKREAGSTEARALFYT